MLETESQRCKDTQERYFKVVKNTPETGGNGLQEESTRDFKDVSDFEREKRVENEANTMINIEERAVFKDITNEVENKNYCHYIATKKTEEIDHQFRKILLQNKRYYTLGESYGFDVSKDRIMVGNRSINTIIAFSPQKFAKMVRKVSQTGHFIKEKGIRVTCKRYGIRTEAFQ